MNPSKYHALLLGADHKLAETLLLVVRLDGGVLGSAGSYADALRQMQSHPPDFVFLDLKSAEGDSLNLLRQLKHHPLPVPVFSLAFGAAGETAATLRAFDLGLNEYIQTPFENGLLRARLAGAQQIRQRLEELTRRQQELTEACRIAEANSPLRQCGSRRGEQPERGRRRQKINDLRRQRPTRAGFRRFAPQKAGIERVHTHPTANFQPANAGL